MGKTIDILGTEYAIKESSDSSVEEMSPFHKSISNAVKRYKVIRAFLYESGFTGEGQNEDMANWIAIQFPKLARAFEELDIEE